MEKKIRKIKTGDHVIYFDEFGKEHNAILTAVWGMNGTGEEDMRIEECLITGNEKQECLVGDCVNLLFVSPDEKREDSYGRQIERRSSCVHILGYQSAWGNGYAVPEQLDEVRAIITKRKAYFRDN